MADSENTVGRTGIYACGENVRRRNSLGSVVLFSLKQEASTSIGGSTFTGKKVKIGYIPKKLSGLFRYILDSDSIQENIISWDRYP